MFFSFKKIIRKSISILGKGAGALLKKEIGREYFDGSFSRNIGNPNSV